MISCSPSELHELELGKFWSCGCRLPLLQLDWDYSILSIVLLRKNGSAVLLRPSNHAYVSVGAMEQKILCCMQFSLMCFVAYNFLQTNHK